MLFIIIKKYIFRELHERKVKPLYQKPESERRGPVQMTRPKHEGSKGRENAIAQKKDKAQTKPST
jgi:hypothetical protein